MAERGLVEDVDDRRGIDAGLDADRPALRHHEVEREARAVVHDFRDRPGADAARVEHAFRDRVEHGARAIEDGAVTARHDQEVARLGALHAAAHRRIQHVDLLRREDAVHAPREQR